MEQQSSINYNPQDLTREYCAAMVLPSDEFSTTLCNFPGSNCFKEWDVRGDFFVSCTIYHKGKRIGTAHTRHCDESGYIEVDFEELLQFSNDPVSGLLLIELCHSKRVPVDLYTSHVHRKTGTYVAYPSGAFIGDKIYTDTHAREMENTLFWPGVVYDTNSEMCLVVMNPYKMSFFYELSFFRPDGSKQKSKVLRVAPFCYKIHPLVEIFPEIKSLSSNELSQCSICVGAQYKLRALVIIRHQETGAYTTMDHLHTYCIY